MTRTTVTRLANVCAGFVLKDGKDKDVNFDNDVKIERFWDLARLTVTTATPLAKALARFRDINDRDKKMSC